MKPVSARKLAANRRNAQHSTGPKTQEGIRRASQNSYKHGFFAHQLFASPEVFARDGDSYDNIFRAYSNHYQPVGDLEVLCIEEIASYSLRLARMLGYEQKVLERRAPYEERSMDKMMRYQTSVTKQIEKKTERLEQLQAQRKTRELSGETSDYQDTLFEPIAEGGLGATYAEASMVPMPAVAQSAVEPADRPSLPESEDSTVADSENLTSQEDDEADGIGSSRFIETATDPCSNFEGLALANDLSNNDDDFDVD